MMIRQETLSHFDILYYALSNNFIYLYRSWNKLVNKQIQQEEMKVNNNQKGKHKEFEDKMNYDFHVKRMNEISFRQKRSQDNILGTSGNYKAQVASRMQSPSLQINHSKIEKQRLVEMQNQRLMKKLHEIGRKRPTFNKQSKQLKQYKTINMKSRKLHRDLKEKFIQQENDHLVQRLINQRNSPSSLFEDMNINVSRSRKRQRRSNSLMLPLINPPLVPELRG